MDVITFVGKSGQLITVQQYGKNDYAVWIRDQIDRNNELAGCSMRGTLLQILQEIKEEV